jgi:hypothetical protein
MCCQACYSPGRGSWLSQSRLLWAPRSSEENSPRCWSISSCSRGTCRRLSCHRGVSRKRAALVEFGNSGTARVRAWLLGSLAYLRTRRTRRSRSGRYCRSGLTSGIGSDRARTYQSRLGGSHRPIERGHLGHRAWRRSPSRYCRTDRQSPRSVTRLARLWRRADGAPTPQADTLCTCNRITLAAILDSDSVHPLQRFQIPRSRRRGKYLRCFSTEH